MKVHFVKNIYSPMAYSSVNYLTKYPLRQPLVDTSPFKGRKTYLQLKYYFKSASISEPKNKVHFVKFYYSPLRFQTEQACGL